MLHPFYMFVNNGHLFVHIGCQSLDGLLYIRQQLTYCLRFIFWEVCSPKPPLKNVSDVARWVKKPRGWMRQVREIDCISIVFYSLSVHYKKSFDLWRNSHDVFKFRHKSYCIHDKLSNFVTDWQCWTWSPIWSPNTMMLCQFRHRS
jgi:hypothetical protein